MVLCGAPPFRTVYHLEMGKWLLSLLSLYVVIFYAVNMMRCWFDNNTYGGKNMSQVPWYWKSGTACVPTLLIILSVSVACLLNKMEYFNISWNGQHRSKMESVFEDLKSRSLKTLSDGIRGWIHVPDWVVGLMWSEYCGFQTSLSTLMGWEGLA